MSRFSLEGLRPVLDVLSDGVCVADAEGRILYSNRAMGRLLMMPPRDLEARPICELLCGALEGPCGEAAKKCALRDPANAQKAITFKGRERRTKRDVRVRCLRARLDGLERHVILLEDDSPEAELERRQEEWRQMLAHDLRVPLTNALGVLRALEDLGAGHALAPDDLELLRIGVRACRRIETLIEAYLQAVRLEAGAMPIHSARVDVVRLIRDCVAEESAEARGHGLELEAHVSPGLEAVGDVDLLRRALMNLIANALKFTPSGGRVSVTGAREKGFVLVRVVDNGPGIAEPDLPRVFERFYQGREGRRGGLGLGLTFCRAAMRAMGGEVCVQSTLGKGSAFTLKLPAAETS